MAEKKKRRVVRSAKPQTVRERAGSGSQTDQKPRRIRRTISQANKPLGRIGRALARIFQPFAFLLWPFKTRPARFIGRILAKILLVNYIRSSWGELRQVQWPNRRQTLKLTLAVFIFAVALTTVIAGVDWVLNKLFKEILLQ